MSTETKYGKEAREALGKGVDAVADVVKVSLGAKGRNVIIPFGGRYVITKDGVSIAKAINPKDEYESIGANLIKEAAHKTNVQAGDGTTTATVIAQDIFNRGMKSLEEGKSPVLLKQGIDQAAKDIVEELNSMAQEVNGDNLEDVASVSANGDREIGKLISDAFNKIGKYGTVLSEDSDTYETYIEVKDGVQLDRGYYHKSFVTDSVKDVCELESPFVLIHKGKLEKGDAVVDLFKTVFSKPSNTLLIITDDIDPFVLSTIVQNVANGAIKGKVCVVKTPQILKIDKDLLSDVATLSKAKVVSEVDGVKLAPTVLGRLEKAVMSEKDSLLVGDESNLKDVIEEINAKIDITTNEFDKAELKERLSRVTGKVATIYIGAKSDSELKEKKDRIEDSINATRSALEEGIVPGGGMALVNVVRGREAKLFPKEGDQSYVAGYEIMLDACMAPALQIIENAGGVDQYIPFSEGLGIDVRTGEIVNMIDAGIIDPKKVTRCAVENAASVAGTFLTTEAVVSTEQLF